MMQQTKPLRIPWMSRFAPLLKGLLILLTGVMLGAWLLNTPDGLLGKADAAGYAVCHRITGRSFFIGERQTPLCARCTGMYLGALLGTIYLARFGKRGGLPPLKISVVLGIFVLAFAVDGGNSYLHFFPGAPGLYQPENWLRLITGSGVGIGIAAVLVPVVHQSLWVNYDERAALLGWKQFLPLLALMALVDLAVLSNLPYLLYPLALLSVLGIFVVLVMVYLVVWVMISKRENRFLHYNQIWVVLLAGFCTALLQIGAFDAVRFWLTHTWDGFHL